jgi:hypothetical protein
MRRLMLLMSVLVVFALPQTILADITLQETLFNLNGTTYSTTAVPGMNSASFNGTTGVGSLTLTFNPGAAGSYFFGAFFDHQLHAPFFNEYGSVSGAPGAGVSYQIDEPGWGDGNRTGTIYDNTANNSLDNTNHLAGTTSNFLGDCGANGGHGVDGSCNNDASMAMAFNFVLAADELAQITLTTSTVQPTGGFFLAQHDPDTPSSLFLTGAITIRSTGGPGGEVPEPGSWLLFGTVAMIAGRTLHRKLSSPQVADGTSADTKA